jgi:Sec20
MLASNLERTANTMMTLRQHSDLLGKAVEVQQDYSNDLSKTKSLLYRLKLTEKLHQYLTLASFLLFCIVVVWVFESRLGLARFTLRLVWSIVSFMLFGWMTSQQNLQPDIAQSV